jgi:hypothetical protein
VQIGMLSGQLGGARGRAKIGWTGEERAMEQICIYKPLCTALLPKMRPMSQNPMFLVPYVTLAATFGVFRLTRLFGPLDTQWFQFRRVLSSYSLVGN